MLRSIFKTLSEPIQYVEKVLCEETRDLSDEYLFIEFVFDPGFKVNPHVSTYPFIGCYKKYNKHNFIVIDNIEIAYINGSSQLQTSRHVDLYGSDWFVVKAKFCTGLG